jgi:hypothetical protein
LRVDAIFLVGYLIFSFKKVFPVAIAVPGSETSREESPRAYKRK